MREAGAFRPCCRHLARRRHGSDPEGLPVRALAVELEGRGFRVWVDEGEMRVGDSLIKRIATAIKDSGGTRRRRPSMGRCPSAKEGHPRKAAVLSGGEERERVPSGPPHLADLRTRIQDHETQVTLSEVIADGEACLAAADDDDVEGRRSLPGGYVATSAGSRRDTLKLNIIPLCACSAM